MRKFTVMDRTTGKYPDLKKIAREEEWANGLIYCDMEGFALEEDGTLVLMDECGSFAYCPHDRFDIKFENEDPWHTGTPTEKGWYVCKIKGLDFMYETQYFTGSNWVEEHFEKWKKLEED